MHKLTNDRRVWGGGALLTGVVLALGYGAGRSVRSVRSAHPPAVRYCAEHPSREAFQTVFRPPPPPGVSELTAAGWALPDRWAICLRFRATDSAIERLTKGD